MNTSSKLNKQHDFACCTIIRFAECNSRLKSMKWVQWRNCIVCKRFRFFDWWELLWQSHSKLTHNTYTHTHTHNKSSKIFFSQFGSHLIWLYKIRTLTFSSRRILDTRIECTKNGFLLQTKQTNFVESFTLLMSNFIRKWKRRRSANRHLNRSSYTFENAIQRWRRE